MNFSSDGAVAYSRRTYASVFQRRLVVYSHRAEINNNNETENVFADKRGILYVGVFNYYSNFDVLRCIIPSNLT